MLVLIVIFIRLMRLVAEVFKTHQKMEMKNDKGIVWFISNSSKIKYRISVKIPTFIKID